MYAKLINRLATNYSPKLGSHYIIIYLLLIIVRINFLLLMYIYLSQSLWLIQSLNS